MITKQLNPAEKSAEDKKKLSRKPEVKKQMDAIATSVLAAIEKGYNRDVTRADWDKVYIPTMNAVTRHRYTGGNRWWLNFIVDQNAWPDPRFVTFKQCSAMKDADGNPATVLRGAAGTSILKPIMFQKKVEIPEDDEPFGDFFEEDGKRYAMVNMTGFHTIRVFNMAQTTIDAPLPLGLAPRDWADDDFFEKFVAAAGVPVKNDHPSKAFYDPVRDDIRMPSKDAFQSADQYYATLLHEFFHATGHSSRMNRGFSTSKDDQYAVEELRAELFSIACADIFGFDYPREKQTNYIAYWRERIKEGNGKAVLKAASDVDAVLSAILDAAEGKQPKLPWFPKINFSDFPTPLKGCMYKNHVAVQQDAASMLSSSVSGPAAKASQQTAGATPHNESDLILCRAILPSEQFETIERGINGPEANTIRETMRDIAEMIRALPDLYVQDHLGRNAIAHMHFTGEDGTEVYLTELDIETGKAFGYTAGTQFPVFDEISIGEIVAMNGRVNLDFEPATIAEISRKYEASEEDMGPCEDDPSIMYGDDEYSMSLSMG